MKNKTWKKIEVLDIPNSALSSQTYGSVTDSQENVS